MVTLLCSFIAILVSADIGSPWLPVVIRTIFSGGYLFIASRSMITPSGTLRYPSSIAVEITLSILLPKTATFLSVRTALLIICCILWIFEANVAMMIRLPSAFAKRFSKELPTLRSEAV